MKSLGCLVVVLCQVWFYLPSIIVFRKPRLLLHISTLCFEEQFIHKLVPLLFSAKLNPDVLFSGL